MLKHFLFAILLSILILLGYVAYHVGYFKPVILSEVPAQQFLLFGKHHLGPYHEIVSKIKEVEEFLKTKGFPCQESFGLYLDNPESIEQARLRSFGGCLVPNTLEFQKYLAELEGSELHVWEAQNFIEAKFEGSPGVGPFKVYPKVAGYLQSKRLESQASVLEKYVMVDANTMVTYYYFPLSGLSSPLVK